MISKLAGFEILPSMELTLQDFLNLHLERWNDQIFEIANVAALEYQLESSLDQMDNDLQMLHFITAEYKDSKTYILQQIDEIVSTIDEQLVTTQTLLTSPYIKPLLKRATEKLEFLHQAHETLDEWILACQKIQEYGEKIGRPLIPIGVRGFDKGTIAQIFTHFNNIINADYNDSISDYGYGPTIYEIYHKLAIGDKNIDLDRFLAPVEIVAEVGKYFAKGFSAIDLEQTKFLFNSGTVGFFIDGTYNAFSMVNNSDFRVDIIPLPLIGPNGKYRDLGRMTEVGGGAGGRFGIPKNARDIELALDFLQFITSYKISQLTMVRHSKWGSPLKQVNYREAFGPEISAMCHCKNKKEMTKKEIEKEVTLLEKCRPYEGLGYTGIANIYAIGGKTQKDHVLTLEDIIIHQPENPKKFFWNSILSRRHDLLQELDETIISEKRTLWNLDGMRATFAVAELQTASPQEKEAYDNRYKLNMEGMINRFQQLETLYQVIEDIPNLKEIE